MLMLACVQQGRHMGRTLKAQGTYALLVFIRLPLDRCEYFHPHLLGTVLDLDACSLSLITYHFWYHIHILNLQVIC